MPKSIRELLDDIEDIKTAYELAERVEAVVELHKEVKGRGRRRYCQECSSIAGLTILYPCPTIRKLEGER